MAAAPAWPTPELPPRRAPATIAPTPSIMAMIDCVVRRGQLLAQSRQMSAGDVAGLVREHADDLVRRLRFHQRAGVDEDAAAVGDEGVERAVVDDDDLDVLLGEPGGAQDRLGVFAQQLLDLGVADDRQAAAALARCAGHAGGNASAAAVSMRDSARALASCARALIGLSSSDHVRSGSCVTHVPAQPSGAPEDGQRGHDHV